MIYCFNTKSLTEKFEVVNQFMYWEQARNYCQERSGDLIQHDPRILTRRGRKLVA